MENESNKQTAVQWLIHNIVEDQTIKAKSMSEWIDIFKQAKEIEKKQMFNSFMAFESNTEENEKLFDEYYKETYGGKDGE